jgi:hypothetical protein
MRVSRLLTATFAAFGLVITAANPGCSSSSDSTFMFDGGVDSSGQDSSMPGNRDSSSDVTTGQDAHHKDAPTMLGMPDVGKPEATVTTEAGFSDAKPDVAVPEAGCDPDAGPPGPGPVKHTCIIYPAGMDSMNECDGFHDPPAPFPKNGTTGNGFDDNCNGLVDEGCSCTNVGTTKTCYLVPASQTENGVPVGWCAQNSVGTMACAQHGEGSPTWSGVCRGAQAPFAEDVCAPGDFNCDGKAENPPNGCSCTMGPVQCPTSPLVTAPYPDPSNLPLVINAASWFTNPADVAMATGWSWTLTGGDCDNILPHPTFGVYATSNATGDPIGTENDMLGMSGKEHGIVAAAPVVTNEIYPAFALSGDYLATASWTLNGMPYTCSVKVQVRAPGIRAEGCWDTEGLGDDLDLHMAKINDFPQCATSHTWSNLAPACASANEDCFYDDCYTAGGVGADVVDWGYPASPASACVGWGSQATGTSCGNPRLDLDANGGDACDPTVTNPNGGGLFSSGPFCGPENINVDHPMNNDRFAVGLRFYNQVAGVNVHAHVDVYCDGARVLASGYDPTTGADFPQLLASGGDSAGDMWKVGILTTQVTGAGLTCAVETTQSFTPDPMRDGSSAYCVDNSDLDGAVSQELLTSSGAEPANAGALCYH